MKKETKSALGNAAVVLLFAFNNIVMLLFSMALAAGISLVLLRFKLLAGDFYSHPSAPFIFALLVGIALAVITAFINRRLMRRYLSVPVKALKQLAAGNFKAEIDFGNLPIPTEYTELADVFNETARELGSIEIMRNDFINNFSHEFKTPIVSIQGFAKQLQRQNLPEEQRKEYTDIIIHEAGRLARLSANILSLSRLEAQTILTGTTVYDLAEQLRSTILLLQNKWESKRMEPELNLDELQITGNRELLAEVWMNIVDNAVKFSPAGVKLRVYLYAEKTDAVVKVQDFGCGMSEEAKKHVFEKFYQEDNSHTVEGNGLGLAVASQIIRLHGGRITVESTAGKGSVFMVTLPLQ
ncbi:MAG TPA: two-component sensor histidine kinase [Treponema sp.]|nr:two-component sensor histidine kinase [Treponema sp.]